MIDDDFDQFEDKSAKPAPRKAPAKKAAPRKRVPTTAKQPQDRKPKAVKQSGAKARLLEASGDEFVVLEQCGVEFKIVADQDEWPLQAIDNLSRGRELDGIRCLLGEDAWNDLLKSGAKLRDLKELGEKFAAAFGFDSLGN